MENLKIEGYSLKKLLGVGGFAEVWLAEREDGTKVAIKIPKFDPRQTISKKDAKDFFEKVELWSKLKHKNILSVLEYGYSQAPYKIPYIALEFCERTLRDIIDVLSEDQIIDIAIKIAEALEFANLHGVIHRDIKPENILICSGEPKVSDWGIAKVLLKATSTSGYAGTPLYSAPEQLNPKEYGNIDWRTDIWQFGCLLYEMFEKEPPFFSEFPGQLTMKILSEEPREPKKMPNWIKEIVMKCLEKKKEDRWRSMTSIVTALKTKKMPSEGKTVHVTESVEIPEVEIPEDLSTVEKAKLVLEKLGQVTTSQLAGVLDLSMEHARKILNLVAFEIETDRWAPKSMVEDIKQKFDELTRKKLWIVSHLAKKLNVSKDNISAVAKELNCHIIDDTVINPNFQIEIPDGKINLDDLAIAYDTVPSVIQYVLDSRIRNEILQTLQPMMQDSSEYVRMNVGIGLGLSFRGTNDIKALELLRPLIGDHIEDIRASAALGLGIAFQGTANKSVLFEFENIINNDSSDSVLANAALGLGLVFQGTGDKRVVDILTELVEHSAGTKWRIAFGFALVLQKTKDQHIDLLLQLLKSSNSNARCSAALALGFAFQGTGDKSISKHLESLLDDTFGDTRKSAMLGIGLIFQDTNEKHPKIVEVLSNPFDYDNTVSTLAAVATGLIFRGSGNIGLNILNPVLDTSDKAIRKAAAIGIGFAIQGDNNKDGLNLLSSILEDSYGEECTGALIGLGLGFQGTGDESIINLLKSLLEDFIDEDQPGLPICLGFVFQGVNKESLELLQTLTKAEGDTEFLRTGSPIGMGYALQGFGKKGLDILQSLSKTEDELVRGGVALGIGLLTLHNANDFLQNMKNRLNLGILWNLLDQLFDWVVELFTIWI